MFTITGRYHAPRSTVEEVSFVKVTDEHTDEELKVAAYAGHQSSYFGSRVTRFDDGHARVSLYTD